MQQFISNYMPYKKVCLDILGYICANTVASLFITAQNCKQLKCSSTVEWKSKLRCIHKMDY